MGEDFPNDEQQRDYSVVVTVHSIPIALIKMSSEVSCPVARTLISNMSTVVLA